MGAEPGTQAIRLPGPRDGGLVNQSPKTGLTEAGLIASALAARDRQDVRQSEAPAGVPPGPHAAIDGVAAPGTGKPCLFLDHDEVIP
jgi:hypothetical protein